MGTKRNSTPGPYLLHLEMLRDRIADPERYPFNLPAIRALSVLPFHPQVTFLLGENGAGKSTLLEAIAVASGLNAEGGSVNFTFATRASHSPLGECIRLAKALTRPCDSYFLRAETFYNVATEIERLDQGPGGPPIIDGYLLDRQGIRDVAYTDTEHYQVTRRFLSNPKRSLETLLGAEPDADSSAGGDS